MVVGKVKAYQAFDIEWVLTNDPPRGNCNTVPMFL